MAGSNGARAGFDANARAQARESGPVILGGTAYFPARVTNRRLRDISRMGRKADVEAKQIGRETQEWLDARNEALDGGKDAQEADKIADGVARDTDEVAEVYVSVQAEQLHILLVDGNGQPVTVETMRAHLEDDVDARDVGPLMEYLVGADTANPTETPTGTITS